jgi:hypothetical protein
VGLEKEERERRSVRVLRIRPKEARTIKGGRKGREEGKGKKRGCGRGSE